jgi:hypothetical protein
MLAGIDTTQLGLEMQAHTHKHNVFIIKIFFPHQPGLPQLTTVNHGLCWWFSLAFDQNHSFFTQRYTCSSFNMTVDNAERNSRFGNALKRAANQEQGALRNFCTQVYFPSTKQPAEGIYSTQVYFPGKNLLSTDKISRNANCVPRCPLSYRNYYTRP